MRVTEEQYKKLKEYLESDIFKNVCEEYHISREDFTCEECEGQFVCEFSFDPYNVHGDCLALK